MRKNAKFAMLVLACGVMLTGCGNDKKNGSTTGQNNAVTVQTTAVTQAQTVEQTKETHPEEMEYTMTGITEYGLTYLKLIPDENGKTMMYVIAPYEYADGTQLNSEKLYVVDYTATVFNGNTATLTRADGGKENWTYDENRQTLTDGKTVFYVNETDLIKNELENSVERISAVYTGNFTSQWGVMYGRLKDGDKNIAFTFQEDGVVTSTISDEYTFFEDMNYYIKDNRIYFKEIYTDGQMKSGDYNKEQGTITINGVLLTIAK